MYALVALCILYSFFLPLCFFILHRGIKHWWRQKKTTSASASHANLIVYNSIFMQLYEILGLLMFLCGSRTGSRVLMSAGFYSWGLTLSGKAFFHILTCAERYLAVVHPLIYLSLKQPRRVNIAYVSIGCVWLLSFSSLLVTLDIKYQTTANLVFASMGFHLVIVSYCSIAVLYVLKRPAPGVGKRVDQSKQRAFCTITALMGVLLLRLGGNMLVHVTYASHVFCDVCVLLIFSLCLDVPSTLVLPLLFLYRVRKSPPRKTG